jgi:hypothetical protein
MHCRSCGKAFSSEQDYYRVLADCKLRRPLPPYENIFCSRGCLRDYYVETTSVVKG